MELKRAYGVLAAVGSRLGERARTEPVILDQVRAARDLAAFRVVVRALIGDRLPPAVLDGFVDEVLTDADWTQWRARLLVQAKMVRDGGKPAPGHEGGGKGVGRP